MGLGPLSGRSARDCTRAASVPPSPSLVLPRSQPESKRLGACLPAVRHAALLAHARRRQHGHLHAAQLHPEHLQHQPRWGRSKACRVCWGPRSVGGRERGVREVETVLNNRGRLSLRWMGQKNQPRAAETGNGSWVHGAAGRGVFRAGSGAAVSLTSDLSLCAAQKSSATPCPTTTCGA